MAAIDPVGNGRGPSCLHKTGREPTRCTVMFHLGGGGSQKNLKKKAAVPGGDRSSVW